MDAPPDMVKMWPGHLESPQIHLGLPTAQQRGFPVASLASDDEAVVWPRCQKAQCPNKLPPRGVWRSEIRQNLDAASDRPEVSIAFCRVSRSNLADPSNRPCSSTKQHHQRPLLTLLGGCSTAVPHITHHDCPPPECGEQIISRHEGVLHISPWARKQQAVSRSFLQNVRSQSEFKRGPHNTPAF